jgi:hypothetical protein
VARAHSPGELLREIGKVDRRDLPRSHTETVTEISQAVFDRALRNPAGRHGDIRQHILRRVGEDPADVIEKLTKLFDAHPGDLALAQIFAEAVPQFVYRFADTERRGHCWLLVERLAVLRDLRKLLRECWARSAANFIGGAVYREPDRCHALLGELEGVHRRNRREQAVRECWAAGVESFVGEWRNNERQKERCRVLTESLAALCEEYPDEISLVRAPKFASPGSVELLKPEFGEKENQGYNAGAMAGLEEKINRFADEVGIQGAARVSFQRHVSAFFAAADGATKPEAPAASQTAGPDFAASADDTTVPARKARRGSTLVELTLPSLPDGLIWPTEHFDKSREYRKHEKNGGGIVNHLDRVWRKIIAVQAVDMPLLRTFYPSTVKGIDEYRYQTVRKTGERRSLPPDLDVPVVQSGSGRRRAGPIPQAAASEATGRAKAKPRAKAKSNLTAARLMATYEILVRESDLANPALSNDERMSRAIHLRKTYDRLRKLIPSFRDDAEQLRLARKLLNGRAYQRRKAVKLSAVA